MKHSLAARLRNARKHTRGFRAWGRELVGVLLVIPTVYFLLQEYASEQGALEEVIAIAGAAAVVLVLIPSLEFGWNFGLAPYRLRIEELEAGEAGDEGSAKLPILPRAQLFVEFDDKRYDFAEPGTRGHPPSTTGACVSLRMSVALNALHHVRVESLELEVLGKRIPSDWEPRTVGGVVFGRYVYFEIPDWVNPGEHLVTLVAFAAGRWWRSPHCTISFPHQTVA